jgi:hypothetical protein
MKKTGLYFILLGLIFVACKVIKKDDHKKERTSLYQISGTPVRALDYKENKKYILDYEVLKSYNVGDSDVIKLDKILSSDSLIMTVNHRSCEFFPAYALKWSSGKVILISMSPCSKIRVMKKATDTVVVNDLKEHSDLEQWVLNTASK